MNTKFDLHAKLQLFKQWWAARQRRERWLLLASSAAVVLVVGDVLVTAPAERRLKQARATVQSQQARIDQAKNASPGSAATAQREQALALQKRLQAAQAAAAAMRQQASNAAQLPETLRAITATVGSARLLALDLSGDVAAPASGAASAQASGAASAAGAAANEAAAVAGVSALPATRLYRLPITLKVSGTYDELHLLLSQIERHAEALKWSSITLDNSDWPAIQLTLKAHVLSPDPRWGAAS